MPAPAGRLLRLVQPRAPMKGETRVCVGSHVVQSLRVSHNPQAQGIQSNSTLYRLFSQDIELTFNSSHTPQLPPTSFSTIHSVPLPQTCFQMFSPVFHNPFLLFRASFYLPGQYMHISQNPRQPRDQYLVRMRLFLPQASLSHITSS